MRHGDTRLRYSGDGVAGGSNQQPTRHSGARRRERPTLQKLWFFSVGRGAPSPAEFVEAQRWLLSSGTAALDGASALPGGNSWFLVGRARRRPPSSWKRREGFFVSHSGARRRERPTWRKLLVFSGRAGAPSPAEFAVCSEIYLIYRIVKIVPAPGSQMISPPPV